MVSNDAGDTVTSVSTDVVDGPLPPTTTVTDVTGAPIARFFEPNQNRRPCRRIRFARDEGRDHRDRGPALLPAQRCGLAGHYPRGDRQLRVRRLVQGASTITQQYVKNYFLYVSAKTETERLKATEQTSARKLKEAQIALQLERSCRKEEILTAT